MNISLSVACKGIVLAIFFLFLGIAPDVCLAQNAITSQIERSREILEKDRALREKLEKEEKAFIKKIIVSGATLLHKDRIKEIILPFQDRWLSKNEIQQILGLVTAAYGQEGFPKQPKNISFEVKKDRLRIKVEELRH